MNLHVFLCFKPPPVLFSTGRCLCFCQAGGLPLSAAALLRPQVRLDALQEQPKGGKGCIPKVILFL